MSRSFNINIQSAQDQVQNISLVFLKSPSVDQLPDFRNSVLGTNQEKQKTNITFSISFHDTHLRWNQSRPRTPPMPISSLNTSVMAMPAQMSSWPRSSQMLVMKEAGLRIRPNSWFLKKINKRNRSFQHFVLVNHQYKIYTDAYLSKLYNDY